MLVNAGGLRSSTQLPGFPTDSFLAFALAVPFIQGALFSTMNAGTDIARDVQTGFVNRLSLTELRDWALLTGQLAGIVVLGIVQGPSTSSSDSQRESDSSRARRGSRFFSSTARSSRSRSARSGLARLPHGLWRGDPGALPRPLRLPLHLVDEHAAQPHRRPVVPHRSDAQSGLVHDRGGTQPHHHGLGLARRWVSGSAS